ncbi:ankyrin repeat domain-containing protein [Brachyspira hyodysenteriae]|uniref:ankyrin repeat domain-containing protein n=1 Tax=Brachyspira hyodysenteriae TaxID=159 RepID=UPI0022CD9263|nr:ankyrin repeat domain-containing protein [Brachyspira hyodysenteriae]MCZ9839332.1 ankyrin repeat domain-containing protein [Brachyspira hyodysenteriae]MCZ9846981.1 ankyrin repeat domain-containing protein [Brachyspira hyodysenteriae]MCZ9850844.1 ankyrin repeat domain-containing protein [Brachyspira hyodysenteriae]MCZ9860403.1 ankyrin repeat domain-containing protein [Brachyspira hyodysenteriae]MCZ9869316.1 ankyrin repeat domain-containing protein [Brachyspira hyodysenteriae]
MKVLSIIIFIISSCISYAQVSDDFKNLAATNKESALYKSVISGNIDEFKYVIENIENNKEYITYSITNIETWSWYNYIPNLSTNSFSNFVKVLLDNGMDINESGKNLILDVSKSYNSHHRPKFGTSKIIGVQDSKYKIETLINLGANINIQDNDGNGILHYILSRDNIATEEYDIFEMLIKNSVNINLQNNDGDTALHKISYKKNNRYRDIKMEKKVISLLIENNADKNIKNNNGKKAYPGAFIYNIKLIFSKIFNMLYYIFLILIIIIVSISSFIFYVISGFIENITGFFR